MSTDLTTTGAWRERNQLAERVDVLDKVKELSTLPGDVYCSTTIVADFYEVDSSSIRTLIERHAKEFESDGYRTVTRADVSLTTGLTWTELGFPAKAHTAALFPRRAVLRVGMLLRDSTIARRVRDYLLDAEKPADAGRARAELLTRADLARMVLEAEEEKAIIAAALESAAPAIAYHERYVSNDDAALIEVWGAQFGMTKPAAFDLLRERKVIYRKHIGRRWSESKKKLVDEYEHRAYGAFIDWFDLRPQHNAPRHHNGQVKQTLYVRQAFALQLAAKCGLSGQLTIDGGAA